MRVLHISNNDFGGAGLCCLRIHKSLLAAGVESKVIVLDKKQNVKGEYQYGRKRGRMRAYLSRLFRMVGLVIADYDKITSLADNYNSYYSLPVSNNDLTRSDLVDWADIIHLHWVNDYLDYPSFFRKIKKPIVWTLHDENLFYGIAHHHKSVLTNNPIEIKYRQIKFDAVTGAKTLSIVFLSQMMFDKFNKESIISGRKKTVINNSVNTQLFVPKDRAAMRRKYGIDKEKLVFVFISTNIADPNKGLDVLSDVLLTINKDAEILAIGGNPSMKEWKNVRSIGFVRNDIEMCELIACGHYMAVPSYQESFSQGTIEALACGVPVVVFPFDGAFDIVNNNNGVICEDFTSGALKKGIESLMNKQYSTNKIRQDVVTRFSPEVIANKYINFYRSIL